MEVAIPELGRSVFVIPQEAFKSKRPHVVILNDIAWSIVEAQRSLHPIWVFPFRGRRIGRMNNKGWQCARRDAGLPLVRVHDLRHSFACRLRAAGVSAEDREALLGHANHSMAGHYASADVGHLLKQANRLLDRSGTRTVLRVGSGRAGPGTEVQQRPTSKGGGLGSARQALELSRGRKELWIRGSTRVPQQLRALGFAFQAFEKWRARQDLNPRPPGS